MTARCPPPQSHHRRASPGLSSSSPCREASGGETLQHHSCPAVGPQRPLLLRRAGWEAERKRRAAGGGRHRPLTSPVTAWRGHKAESALDASSHGTVGFCWAAESLPKWLCHGAAPKRGKPCASLPARPDWVSPEWAALRFGNV